MDDTLHEYKMQFAALLQRVAKNQRYLSAATVARQVLGKEQAERYPAYVCQIAEEWPFDPEVIAEMDRLSLIVPPKEVILNEVYSWIMSRETETKDKISAMRLFTDVMGWTGKATKDDGKADLSKLAELINASK